MKEQISGKMQITETDSRRKKSEQPCKKQVKLVIIKVPTKKRPGPDCFTGEFH